jgi:UDP-galactose transporter
MMGSSAESPSKAKGEDVIIGGLAALAAAGTSGFAGVYFEMVLKGSDTSVWVRNIHLATFGVMVALFGVVSQPGDMSLVKVNGFFGGYDQVVWALVMVQALGGLLVAAVVKYTDNILKAFATSASLVAVSVISVIFFNFPAPPLFLFGTTLVVYAMFLYGDILPSWLTGSDICHILRYSLFGTNSPEVGIRTRTMSANSTLSSPPPNTKDSNNHSLDNDIELQKEEEKALLGT